MIIEDLKSFPDYRIILVDVFCPCLLIQHIVDDAAVENTVQQLVRLADEKVTALQSALVGIIDKLLYQVLLIKIIGEFHHLLEIVQLRTVVVRIGKCKLENQSAHARFLEVRCHTQGIFRNEDIWSDATTAINHSANAGMVSRTGMLDAILREELAMLITGEEILLVVTAVAQSIWLLDTSA